MTGIQNHGRMDSRTPTKDEVDALLRTVQVPSIQKAILQSLCVVNGLAKTGNKADLQKRLMKCKFATASPLSPVRGIPANSCFFFARTVIGESRADSQKISEIRESIRTLAGIPLAQPVAQPPPPPPQAQPPYYPPASPRAPSHYATAMPTYNPPGSYLPVSNGHRANLNATPFAQLSTLPLAPTKHRFNPPRQNVNAHFANGVLTISAGLAYKPSPFHEIMCRLGELKTCEGTSLPPLSVALLI